MNFGDLGIGSAAEVDQTVTLTPTGNTGLDQDISGSNMTDGANTIPVSAQKYAVSSGTDYASATALSTSAARLPLHIPKPLSLTPTTGLVYFGIQIPAETPQGTYTGSILFSGIMSNSNDW